MAIHHWILRGTFAGLALWLLFVAWAQSELGAGRQLPGDEAAGQRILVLHGEGNALEATLAANLAGRFGRATLRPIGRYRLGDSGRFDATFVLAGTSAASPPPALLADVRRAALPVIWIQHGIRSLFGAPEAAAGLGWAPGPTRPADWIVVRYKGRDFPRDLRVAADAAEPIVADPARARILATATGADGRERPWAVRSGHLLYVAESPFAYAHEDDRYLVFADLLFEMLAPDTPERHRAMVRIEGVGPDADPRRVRALADVLAAERVPFGIAVYDLYRDPSGIHSGRPVALPLAGRPRLVRALRYAVSRGGTLIAHGHTHQSDVRPNPRDRVSGDYEFFAADMAGGAAVLRGPLARDGEAYWRARLGASRRGWRRAGLDHPFLFAMPNDAASPAAYAAIRSAYPARWERVLYFAGDRWQAQFFPFEVVDTRGDFIIPENLGFVSARRPAERLIAAAERNLAVRDGFASFPHHWHDDPESLRRTVRAVRSLGYRFVGPEEVIRLAPVHAARALRRPAPLAAVAGGWVGALPKLSAAPLLALLALVAAMWMAGERLLRSPRLA